jgi:hypothetical protein
MNSTKKRIIEFAPFQLVEGVDESTLLAASDALQAEFLSQQKGFIKRDLVKNGDGKWADIAYWEDRESVEQAMQNAPANPAALRYFQLMANAEKADASADVMLLHIAKSYS